MKVKYPHLILGLLALFCFNNNTYSQILEHTHFRVEAGVTASKISNFGQESSTLVSFRTGATASVPINFSNFEISTGILLTQKGEYFLTSRTEEIKNNPTFLVIPLDLSYRIDIDEYGCFYVNAGPYMGVGIVGSKLNYKFDKDGILKRLELGIGISGMIEYHNYTARIGGEIGLTSAIKKKFHPINSSPHNFQIYLTLGYRLFNW